MDPVTIVVGSALTEHGYPELVAGRLNAILRRGRIASRRNSTWLRDTAPSREDSPWGEVERMCWLAARGDALGAGTTPAHRLHNFLKALALGQVEGDTTRVPDPDAPLESAVLELAALTLMLETVWSDAVRREGAALWRPGSFEAALRPREIDELAVLPSRMTAGRSRPQRVDGWIEYQAGLVFSGLQELAEAEILSSREAAGIKSRLGRLLLEIAGNSLWAVPPLAPIAFPDDYNDGPPRTFEALNGTGAVKFADSAAKVPHKLQAATNPVVENGGITVEHLEWLASLVRFLILKGSCANRSRSDLAMAISLMRPQGPAPTRRRSWHETTSLNQVPEGLGSEAVAELVDLLGECDCTDPASCEDVDLLAKVLALGSSDEVASYAICTGHDRRLELALERAGSPYRIAVPAIAAGGSRAEWLFLGIEPGGSVRRLAWPDSKSLSGPEDPDRLSGVGPILVRVHGAPLLLLPDGWTPHVSIGETALFGLLEDMPADLWVLLRAALSAESGRDVLYLGFDGTSLTERFGIHRLNRIWTSVSLDGGPDSRARLPVYSLSEEYPPQMYFDDAGLSPKGGSAHAMQRLRERAASSNSPSGGVR